MNQDRVSALSLGQANRDPDAFAATIGRGLTEHGFVIVSDHGIPERLIERAGLAALEFFGLTEAVKRRYHLPGGGGARGYTPFGVETAKGAEAYDLKEFWHVGRELDPENPLDRSLPPNVWPDEVAGFREIFLELYAAFDRVGLTLMRAIAGYLGVDGDRLSGAAEDGNSVLRLLHYPPVSAEPGTHLRAGAHEDINAITLLLGAEQAGLELLTREGRWMAVSPGPGELVVNIGDMLQRLTNGVLRSTSHRVVNPPPEQRGRSRYAMPFFLHFRSDFVLEALPETVLPGTEPHWPPITADEFLQERLREIKLA